MSNSIESKSQRKEHLQSCNKRVLAVVRYPVGGVRTHIVYTYRLLLDAGYQFTFLIPQCDACEAFRQDVAEWKDAQVIEVPYNNARSPKPLFRPTVRRLLKERQYNLIHSHGMQAAIPAIFANLGINVPHVLTSQDVFDRVGIRGFIGRLKLHGLSKLLSRLDALIAVSNDTREDHLRYLPGLNGSSCRIEMIHNGVPIEQYLPCDNNSVNLRESLGIEGNVTLIGFLGRFVEQKGFLILIDAIERLVQDRTCEDFHVVAVGSGDMLVNYQHELERRPEVASRFSFLGHTPNSAPILRELDLLVMPSLWEAHPLLPMEALLLGIPIVGTSCLGLREVLSGTPSMVVPPADGNALANALARSMSNPWKQAALDYIPMARERFDVRKTAKRLICLYEAITRCSH